MSAHHVGVVRKRVQHLLIAAVTIPALACSDGSTAPDPDSDGVPETGLITLDVSQEPVHLRLGDSAQVVHASDPSSSTDWDVALHEFSVRLNGGDSSAGDVSGHCICQNEGLSDEEVQALTAEDELEAFEAVAESSIPPSSAFEYDDLIPSITEWYSGSAGSGAAADSSQFWILRRGSSSPIYSKVRVVGLEDGTTASPGLLTIEYATQPSAGESMGSPTLQDLDLRTGPVYFSMSEGVVTEDDGWDLLFDGWRIQVNGGVSGTGDVSAVSAAGQSFEEIDAAFAASVPAFVFDSDRIGGVFDSHPWYRYNLTGTDHQVWPVYDIYLIRRGDQTYKVQFISYYDESGSSGQVTLRYARVGS